MKKLIALLAIVALAVSILGPALTVAVTDPTVTTGLIKGTGGGSVPIVKVKWEMDAPYASLLGTDDSTAPGAQFDAPGIWGNNMNYSVCAIVTDPNGAADIYGVYADIYYPIDRKMHKPGEDPDYPTGGCGAFIEQNTLVKLSKADGYNLFCNTIRNNNNNLPVFATSYGYDEICKSDGELMKEEAYVWCDNKSLTWEDPAGLYRVVVSALDKAGNKSALLENYFEYLQFTGFAIDFTTVNYGEVLLSTKKKISGDKTFSTAANPTVRNTGNTRLNMKVAQDDMGLGKSSDLWNVEYDARVGNAETDWKIYNPFKFKETPGPGTSPTSSQYKTLAEILDLSETEEMDFSIHVKKWPDGETSYSGWMWLTASQAAWASCGG